VQKILVYINIILAISLLLSYLSSFISPTQIGHLALFGLFYPYLLIINVFFFLFWLITEWKYGAISLLTIILGFNHLSSFYGINSRSVTEEPKDLIKVGSMNINAGYFFRINDQALSEQRKDQLKTVFLNNSLDIICLQESNHVVNSFVASSLESYHQASEDRTTTSIFSKYPIKDYGSLTINERKNKTCLWADIIVGKETVRVYSVHLYSNKLTKETEAIIEDRSFGDERMIDDLRYILGSYINSSRKRVKEMDIILEHVRKSPFPVIMAGDFNDTPQSYSYRQIKNAGFCDAFQDSADGLGTTYAGSLPLLRIDYCFADKDRFKTIEHQIVKKRMSDHFPLISVFKLSRQ